MIKRLILFAILISITLSCGDSYYAETYSFDEGWRKEEILDFSIEIQEPNKDYDFYFVVRNTDDYPYRNLILFTDFEGARDTMYYNLADKNGQWIGTGMGSEKTVKLEFKHNYHFKDKGTKSLRIQQAMRKDTLYGIEDISVIIDKKN